MNPSFNWACIGFVVGVGFVGGGLFLHTSRLASHQWTAQQALPRIEYHVRRLDPILFEPLMLCLEQNKLIERDASVNSIPIRLLFHSSARE
jgi:hypothetical protein